MKSMDKSIAQLRYFYFIALFASAIYCRAVFIAHEFKNVTGQIVIFLILFLFFHPRSTVVIFLFALSVFIHLFFFTHTPVNDVLLERIVSLGIVLTILWYMFKYKNTRTLGDDFYNSIFPSLRILLVGLYFFCFFSKLNTGYLDIHHSFASQMLDEIRQGCYLAPINWFLGLPWIKPAAIWGSILTEGTLWIALILKKTRPWAIVLGSIFHFFIGFEHKHSLAVFSWLMLVLYFVFLSDDAVLCFDGWVAKIRGILGKAISTVFVQRLIQGTIFYLPILLHYSYRHIKFRRYWFMCWLLAYFVLFGMYITTAWKTRLTKEVEDLKRYWGKPLFLSVLTTIIVLFNGLGIYIGFWQAYVFCPFSDLRMRPISNHLIIRSTILLEPYTNVVILNKEKLK